MNNPKYPYCINCDAPTEKIDYTAELDSFEARGGTVITYVKVAAFCHWCGTELYVPAVNDMNKLSRDNAYAVMKQDRAKGKWIRDAYTGRYRCSQCGAPVPLSKDDDDEYICIANFCSDCGADMRKEVNNE